MCGIAGRFNYLSGAPVDKHVVRGMCDLLAHRGPDGDGVWSNGAIALGHRRLAIIDLSPAGRQPMSTSDGALQITFNGEIYNYRDLRLELERCGHHFRTRTDTEVILNAYVEWGVECLSRLSGMFAFALWDSAKRTLFIARDRLGKKPLHYLLDRDGVAFASEPKAFLADPAFQARPNVEAISAYLTYQYVPSPLSAFEGVHKLPAAHYVLVRDGRMTIERYWKLSYRAKLRISEDEACAELLDQLRRAVRRRLISDVPLGAFLSGGVDSGTIVALMATESGAPVKTFSIGFDEKNFDELPYARLVADRYRTDHHEFVVRPNASEIFPHLVWHYNEPYADSSAIPTYYLSQLARRHVTVALNGDAGDENFAGYRRYITPAAAQQFQRLPAGLQRLTRRVISGRQPPGRSRSLASRGRRWLYKASATPADRYARRMMLFEPQLKHEICDPDFLAQASDCDFLVNAFLGSDASEVVDAQLDVDVSTYLTDCLLVKVDIATMAHGLEGRSPMLDHEFMEFAASLPVGLKLNGNITKYILKRAVRGLLPSEIIDRPKKGFSVPLDAWFRHDLRDMAGDLLLDGRLERRGYFKPGAVRGLLEEHWRGAASWHNQLWSIVMLESWHRMFIDERPAVGVGTPALSVGV